MWKNRIIVHCWWEYKTVQLLQKTIGRFRKNFKEFKLHDPAIPLLGIYCKQLQETFAHVHSSAIHNGQGVQATQVPVADDSLSRMCHSHSGALHSQEKEWTVDMLQHGRTLEFTL